MCMCFVVVVVVVVEVVCMYVCKCVSDFCTSLLKNRIAEY